MPVLGRELYDGGFIAVDIVMQASYGWL